MRIVMLHMYLVTFLCSNQLCCFEYVQRLLNNQQNLLNMHEDY